MASHAQRVLGGVLNKNSPRRDLLAQAIIRLDKEHFFDQTEKTIWAFLVKYFDKTGDVMPLGIFTEALTSAGMDAAKTIAMSRTFEAISGLDIGESDFKWSLDELRSEQAKRQTGVALVSAMQILEQGYEDPKGKFWTGHEEAREFLASQLAFIDKVSGTQDAPEGNIFTEYEAILKDYELRESGEVGQGILTGIAAIDERTGGWQPGELIMVCAYAGQGKSQLVTQAAWDCAVVQKKNVFFATSETLRHQVMRRLAARHSMLPIFDHPINSADIKKGTLSPADKKVLSDVMEDWHYNTEYGTLNVVQIPSHTKLTYVENRLKEYAKEVEVSLAIDDYLPLHAPLQKRGNEREEFNDSIRYAKGIATELEVPFASPWQITRTAYDNAKSLGYLSKASLSDTSEAEKSADQIIALLRDEENNTDMRLQYLKMRDDDVPPITSVAIDFRSSYIGAHRAGPTSISAGTRNTDDLLSYV